MPCPAVPSKETQGKRQLESQESATLEDRSIWENRYNPAEPKETSVGFLLQHHAPPPDEGFSTPDIPTAIRMQRKAKKTDIQLDSVS